jgi:hypothetical protein
MDEIAFVCRSYVRNGWKTTNYIIICVQRYTKKRDKRAFYSCFFDKEIFSCLQNGKYEN